MTSNGVTYTRFQAYIVVTYTEPIELMPGNVVQRTSNMVLPTTVSLQTTYTASFTTGAVRVESRYVARKMTAAYRRLACLWGRAPYGWCKAEGRALGA